MQQEPSMLGERGAGCGERLRKAREAAGLSPVDVAVRLKMPVRVVLSLEQEDWSRLGAPVFVRGQLRSYSRLLGLTTEPVVAAAGLAPVEPPKLIPRTYTPASHRLAELFARRFVYIVLTAAIAVPVWLATRSQLGEIVYEAAPLDMPGPSANTSATTPAHKSATRDPGTVLASLASLPSRAAASAEPMLSLRFKGDSWVEVIGRDGKPLEQSLLHAGEQRQYPSSEVAHVTLGNAAAVEVTGNGQIQELGAYQRANVARFAVSSDGSLAPSTQ